MNIHETYQSRYKRSREVNLLLVLSCQELSPSQVEQARKLADNELDWESFVKLTFQHELIPLVFQNLKQHLHDLVPDSIIDEMKTHNLQNAQSNLALLNELFQVIDFLNANKIPCLTFKGLVNAEMIYKDLSARKAGDIDLLVKEEHYQKAKNLFLDQGFSQSLTDEVESNCMQSGLFHEQRRLAIDLHYGIQPKLLAIQSDKVFEHATTCSLAGREIPTFSLIDTIIILSINAAKDYWNQRLYTYADLNVLIQQHPDLNWKTIMDRASELHCKRIMLTALLVVDQLYDLEKTPYLEKQLNASKPLRMIANELLIQLLPDGYENFQCIKGKPYLLSSDQYFHQHRMDKSIARLNYRLPKAIAYSDKDIRFMKLPDQFAFLYYAIRPVRLLRDYMFSRQNKNQL